MSTDDLRSLILAQLDAYGVTVHHAASLAGLPDQTARDYLSGRTDLTAGRAFRLAAAAGLVVSVVRRKGYAPPPAGVSPGRPKKNPGKSGF